VHKPPALPSLHINKSHQTLHRLAHFQASAITTVSAPQRHQPASLPTMPILNSIHPTAVMPHNEEPVTIYPQISSSTLLAASPKDKQSLVEIHALLNSLFIRNRNQHRRNHWFKSLQQFRKQLGLLLSEMETGTSATKAAKLTARLQFWDEKCIHEWYL
jgi:ribonuclease MRP protein subunit RMP1